MSAVERNSRDAITLIQSTRTAVELVQYHYKKWQSTFYAKTVHHNVLVADETRIRSSICIAR